MDYKRVLDRNLLGTKLNHPEFDAGEAMFISVENYIEEIANNSRLDFNMFVSFLSRESSLYGVELRSGMKDFVLNDKDIILDMLDTIYFYALKNMKNTKYSPELIETMKAYVLNYFNIVKESNLTLEKVKDIIYQNPRILIKLINNLKPIVNEYVKELNPDEVFKSITIIEKTETANYVLNNIGEFSLKNSFNGKLLSGNITVSSDIGYKENRRPQQDSVLSIAKNDNCFINVVADGAGGSISGEKASKAIILKLQEWFLNLDENLVSDSSNIRSLEQQLYTIIDDVDINLKENPEYSGSYSTVVIALTVYDKTIIANVGDSTAYAYDEASDKLIELTTLDSPSAGLSYEGARYNPNNNVITSAIGGHLDGVHFNVIGNVGQKIILSSDGVTDLISEDRFKSYFKSNVDAVKIVNDAVYNPDVEGLNKKEDNVSAIVINLPDYSKELGRGLK